MKRLKVGLILVIMAIGVGSAFASNRFFADDGYQYVSSNPAGSRCVFIKSCEGGDNPCKTISSPQLRLRIGATGDDCETTTLLTQQ